MRELNSRAGDRSGQRLGPARPGAHCFEAHGKRLALDASSLAAWELAGGEDPGAISPASLAPQFAPPRPTGFRTVVLEVTHACNLRCSYCFVRNCNPDRSGAVMSVSTAVRAASLIESVPGSKEQALAVGFFGGEPLTAFGRVREIVECLEAVARSRGARARFSMTTNGTLLDDEKIEFLGVHGFSLIVSLDGPAERHNRHRPMPGGDSHAATLAAVRRLRERRGIGHVTLRSTFTGEGVDLVERLEYLNALCDEGCADHVSVEPVSLSESGCIALPDGHSLAIPPGRAAELRGEYSRAAEWFRDRLRKGLRARFHHFYRMLERLAGRAHAPSECGAGCGYAAVGPDGTVYACHREGPSRIGRLDSGIDEAARAAWSDNRLYARRGCMDCWARWLCGGGCRIDSLERSGDISVPEGASCVFKRTFAEEAVWLLSELTEEELARALMRGGAGRERACAAKTRVPA